MVEDLHDDIVQRMREGDSDAFATILDHHLSQVLGYVKRILPMTPAADAEDIAQETFIRLWTARERFDVDRARLSTWLHRIAHNLCIDHLRKHKHDADLVDSETSDGPDTIAETDDQSARVNVALMKLDERQRSALVLCHYQGFSNKQAAAILEISVDALESLLRRSRSKLKEILLKS